MGNFLDVCLGKQRKYYKKIYTFEPQIRKHEELFSSLQLQEVDVGRMRKIFNKCDNDRSGSIELLELLMYLDIERTPFTKRVFGIFDDDNSGEIDFKEFIMALWNYCTLSKATLVLFAFDIYDRDSSGELNLDEVKQMLRDVYGDAYHRSAHAKNILIQLDEMAGPGTDGVDIDEFRAFSQKHQALLYPAFEIQRMIQSKILGEEFWNLLSLRRMELSEGKYIPIGEFMQLHINKNVYYKHVKTAYIKKRNNGKNGSSSGSSSSGGLKKSTKKIIAATGTKSTRMNRANINNPDAIAYELPSPTRNIIDGNSRTNNGSLVDISELKETVISDLDYSNSSSSRNRSSMSMKATMISTTTNPNPKSNGSYTGNTNDDTDNSVVTATYGGSQSSKASTSTTGRTTHGARSWGNPHTYNKNIGGSGFTRSRNNTIIGSSSSSSSGSSGNTSQSARVRRGTIL